MEIKYDIYKTANEEWLAQIIKERGLSIKKIRTYLKLIGYKEEDIQKFLLKYNLES